MFSKIVWKNRRKVPAAAVRVEDRSTVEHRLPRNSCRQVCCVFVAVAIDDGPGYDFTTKSHWNYERTHNTAAKSVDVNTRAAHGNLNVHRVCVVYVCLSLFVTTARSIILLRYYSASALLAMQSAVLARPFLSVWPSVTFRYCVQTNEDTIVWFSASGRTILLDSGEVKFIRIFAGYHPQQ